MNTLGSIAKSLPKISRGKQDKCQYKGSFHLFFFLRDELM